MCCLNIVLRHLYIKVLSLLQRGLSLLKLLVDKVLLWVLDVYVPLFVDHALLIDWLRRECLILAPISMFVKL